MKEWLSRSWLFEVVDIVSEIVEKSFTLVLPPQQYSIKEKARVSITKTFGNAFIDDYGADNIEITIKGISGTSHVFPTFDTSGKASTGQPFNAYLSDVNTITYHFSNATGSTDDVKVPWQVIEYY